MSTQIPGIESVHELHIWRLDQKKAIASAHIVVSSNEVTDFMERARTISECLHAYGIHSATLQPELSMETSTTTTAAVNTPTPPPSSKNNDPAVPTLATGTNSVNDGSSSSDKGGISFANPSVRICRLEGTTACQITCSGGCENLTCCNTSMRI